MHPRKSIVSLACIAAVASLLSTSLFAEARTRFSSRQSGADLYAFSEEEALEAFLHSSERPVLLQNPKLSFDSDVPKEVQDQMLADLAFVQTIRGDSASKLHQKIFGNLDGASYGNFFKSRVFSIGLDDCGMGKAVACVIPFEDPSKMWLTKNFIGFSHPQIARLMIVFHEARHTESRHMHWPHAICPTPFQDAQGKDKLSIWTGAILEGEPACDQTVFGSYGSSAIMLKNIQKHCTNCSEKVKMDAGLYGDDQMGRLIDAKAKADMDADLGA